MPDARFALHISDRRVVRVVDRDDPVVRPDLTALPELRARPPQPELREVLP
jgi:hypothetical protein